MNFKKLLCAVSVVLGCSVAHADLTINHREGSAPIDKFHLKIMALDGKTCYEQRVVDQFTQKITISSAELENCGPQSQYAVYGIIHGWVYDYTFYGDKYPKNNGECTITHEQDGYVNTKLAIRCK